MVVKLVEVNALLKALLLIRYSLSPRLNKDIFSDVKSAFRF